MGRERDGLYITVPNLFRCPISLDVMKSPVSLSTGVTYDRSSIQKWLETGHDTCPATMQILPSKDFVPNLTLLRLINLWNQSSSSRRPDSAASEDQVRIWIQKIRSSGEKKEEFLSQVAEFAGSSDHNRRFLVAIAGFVETIVVAMGEGRFGESELAVRILGLVSGENGVKEKLHRLLILQSGDRNRLSPLTSVLLEAENSRSKIEAIRILDSISIDNESKRFVAETEDLVPVLLSLLLGPGPDTKLQGAVLSLLISVAVTRSLRSRLVELGLVGFLSRTVSDGNAAVPLAEKSLKLLSLLSTCPEGRAAISGDPNCVGGIVERLMKVSKPATEDAMTVLWGMCCLFKDGTVAEKAVRNHGVTKVLLVMQSEGEGNVRSMCRELVKALRTGYRGNGCAGAGSDDGFVVESYDTKTTHIMPY